MPTRSALLAASIALWSAAAAAAVENPPAADPDTPPAEAAPAEPQAYFPALLKEGEKLPDPAQVRAAERAAAREAGFQQAVKDSLDIALHLGAYAVNLIAAIAVAGLGGLGVAALVTVIRNRRAKKGASAG